jgi:hypothetical protein
VESLSGADFDDSRKMQAKRKAASKEMLAAMSNNSELYFSGFCFDGGIGNKPSVS